MLPRVGLAVSLASLAFQLTVLNPWHTHISR